MSAAKSKTYFEQLRSRRWLQYSLRSLLVLTTVLCLWLGWRAHRAHEQRAAVAYLRSVDEGAIIYNRRTEDLWVPDWLRERIGDDFFRSVVEVHLTQGVTGENLPKVVAHLSRLPKLSTLYLWHAKVTDDDLRYLVPLTQITHLGLHFPHEPVTGMGIRDLVGMTNVRQLTLQGGSIANEAVAFVPQFAQLESVEVGFSGISDAGIQHLEACPKLTNLTLCACYCRRQGLESLVNIRALKKLSFMNMDLVSGTEMYEPVQLVPIGRVDEMLNAMQRIDSLKKWLHERRPDVEVTVWYHDA